MNTIDAIREECWNQALYCFGTSYIFETRARRLRRCLRAIVFLGIATPALLGTTVATYGPDSWLTGVLIAVTSVLGLVQVIVSVWALVARWDDDFSYAGESQTANRSLYDKYRLLASNPPPTLVEANAQYAVISTEAQARATTDERQQITDKEKRKGMRAGLRQLKRQCLSCGKVPVSMKSTACDVCGNF